MALDYVATSKALVEAVGGAGNISSATHCMTRLRLVLVDESKANDEAVKGIKGVKSVIKQGGQYQIVIGNEVSNLFKEFQKLGHFTEDAGAAGSEKPKGNPIQRLFGFIAGCMTPLLPAMLGTGMVKVLLTLLTTVGLMKTTGATYIMLYSMADAFFYFLPIFLAVTIAKKMNHSIPLFMVIGAMLCYPDLINLLGGGIETAKMGQVFGLNCTYLLGFIPVISATYTSSVLPMLLMAPVMAWAEDFADRVSPNVLKAFLKPMIFLLICTPIALCILGPLGNVIGTAMSGVFSAMYTTMPWLTVAVLSAIMPFIVMTGMHYALIPLCMNNMATLGYDVIVLVTMFCSNIAQGGASLGVALKSKDTDTKSEGIACGISAVIAGVTEPAMYGINLRYGKPMVAAVIGAGASGLFAGLTGVKAYTMGGSPSLLSVIQFVNTSGEGNAVIGVFLGIVAAAISLGLSLLLSMLFFKDEAAAETVSETAAAPQVNAAPVRSEAAENTSGPITLASPLNGRVVALKDIPDEVFASASLGQGVGILPKDGNVYAPADGVINTLMQDSRHAIGLTTDSGVDVLIHVGLDTVAMKGAGFTYKVAEGDRVSKGQLLMTADLNEIMGSGYKTHTPVLVTNTDDYASVTALAEGEVSVGDPLLCIQ